MELYLNDLHEGEIEWELDIVSQALFTRNCKIFYKIDIAYHFDHKIYVPGSKTELELFKAKLNSNKARLTGYLELFQLNKDTKH